MFTVSGEDVGAGWYLDKAVVCFAELAREALFFFLFLTSVLNVNRKCVQVSMYTHASTNKHHNETSTLNREMEEEQGRTKSRQYKTGSQGLERCCWLFNKFIFVNCVKKDRKLWVTQTLNNKYFWYNFKQLNLCREFSEGGSLWGANWKKWHTNVGTQ